VIHAGLTILGRVDSVSLTELDLTEVLKAVHLPSHKGVVVWVGVSGNKTSSPIDSGTKVGTVTLTKRREILKPVLGVGKVLNFFSGNTELEENFKLELGTTLFSSSLRLGGLELGDILALGFSSSGLGGLLKIIRGKVLVKVLTELLNFTNQLISTSLNRHTGAVETKREKSTLAQHSLETGGKLNLGESEAVTGMEDTIHVRVSHGTKKLGVLRSKLSRRDNRIVGRGVNLEGLLLSPKLLVSFLDVDKGITTRGLGAKISNVDMI